MQMFDHPEIDWVLGFLFFENVGAGLNYGCPRNLWMREEVMGRATVSKSRMGVELKAFADIPITKTN